MSRFAIHNPYFIVVVCLLAAHIPGALAGRAGWALISPFVPRMARDFCAFEGVADLGHGADQFDVGGFEHRVGAFYQRDQSSCFDHSNCLMSHS